MTAEIRADFQILSPLFLGGATQTPELRAPSIKGALRFWYRAICPAYQRGTRNEHLLEERIFGGTGLGSGQSPMLLRVDSEKPLRMENWSRDRFRNRSKGESRNEQKGIIYLGFPFGMKKNALGDPIPASYLIPEQRFSIRCVLPRAGEDEDIRRALLASVWLLGHLGALGSRSRRGFGAVALVNWETPDWRDARDLPVLARDAADAKGWRTGFMDGLRVMRGWFGDFPGETVAHHHPHIGAKFGPLLQNRSFTTKDWTLALDLMGSKLQEFRLRRPPDYDSVKAHLNGTQSITKAPERSGFGLPLTFRFTSLNGRRTTFVPLQDEAGAPNLERHGSLLFLRPVLTAGRLHPLYFRLDGDQPGVSPPLIERECSQEGERAGQSRRRGPGRRSGGSPPIASRRGLLPPESDIVDLFFEWLRTPRNG